MLDGGDILPGDQARIPIQGVAGGVHLPVSPLSALRRLGNDLAFLFERSREWGRRSPNPLLTRHPQHLAELRHHGIAFIENFVDDKVLKSIISAIASRTDLLGLGVGPGIVKKNARRLLLEADVRIPEAVDFFCHPDVSGIARAYLSPLAVPDRHAVQLKCDIQESCIVDFFHIDEWRPLISVFLFLEDVDIGCAPMIYLKGSHRTSLWKLAKEREFFQYYQKRPDGTYNNDESAYCGCYLPTEVRRICEMRKFEPVLCTGKAGTLMVFDNLGLHRATPLQHRRRLVLSSYWLLPREKAKRSWGGGSDGAPVGKARGLNMRSYYEQMP